MPPLMGLPSQTRSSSGWPITLQKRAFFPSGPFMSEGTFLRNAQPDSPPVSLARLVFHELRLN